MISILMPIYNGSEFFEQSYNSILNQTFKSWELLIGINGYELESSIYKKINLITQNEKKVKIFQFPNFCSKTKTLNILKNYSENEIICLLDVDDYWKYDKLEKQIYYMEFYDVVGTRCQYFDNSNIIPNIPYGQINSNLFTSCNPIINSSSMFFKKDAFWNEQLEAIEDYEMWLRLNKQNKKFFNIKEILCYHRIHKDSFFNTKDNYQIEKFVKKMWLE